MEVFKVVEKQTRRSSNWAIYCESTGRNPKKLIPEWERYLPQYLPNTYVHALSGSVGIFCFESIEYAKLFIGKEFCTHTTFPLIIKVRGIGKPKHPSCIIMGCGGDPRNIAIGIRKASNIPFILRSTAPSGTVTFPAVEVLT